MKKETKQKTKNFVAYFVVFIGIIAYLEEFQNVRDDVNLLFISIAITVIIVVIWEGVIRRIIDKWL